MQLSAIPRLSIETRLNFERQAGRGKIRESVVTPSHCNQYASGFKIWFGENRPDYTHWDYCVGYY